MNKILVVIISFVFACNSSNILKSEQERHKTAEELMKDLKTEEQKNPKSYLITKATISPNRVKIRNAGLFREAEYATDGYYINGIIKNTAKVARFKDVILLISYSSQTGTVIEEEEHILYEFYEPNISKSFSIHVYPPDAMSQFNVTIKTATSL